MNAIHQIHSIQLADIDLEDNTYRLCPWEESPSDDLLASINIFGILHPPFLLQQMNQYKIIAGRKRIIAAQLCSTEQDIPCHVIPSDTEHKTIFSFLLEDALNGRPPSIVEQITFFELFLQTSAKEDALPLLKKLGHKPQEHVLQSILKLRSLSVDALSALHHDIISTKNAYQLLTLSASDQQIIIRLITKLRLGGSKQRKLIELCRELIKREDLPLEQIFSESPVSKFDKMQKNIPQQSTVLLSWLKKKCFPRSSQAEKNFTQQVTSLNLPSNMEAIHTPSFEDEETTLSIRFSNWHSLEKTIKGIKTIVLEDKNIKSID